MIWVRGIASLLVGSLVTSNGTLAVVDLAGLATGAGHRDALAGLQRGGGELAADHRRHAEFARDDRGVAGAAATVGDDRAGGLHHRLPVRAGEAGDQHLAGLEARNSSVVLMTRTMPVPIFSPTALPVTRTLPSPFSA